jgi:hypothetical protein
MMIGALANLRPASIIPVQVNRFQAQFRRVSTALRIAEFARQWLKTSPQNNHTQRFNSDNLSG